MDSGADSSSTLHEPFTTASTSNRILDLATVIKATQTLSEEIFLDRLLVSILSILMENAGAEKGALILEDNGKLFIEAYGPVSDGSIEVMKSIPLETAEFVPPSIIQYVKRTGESVVLGNATVSGLFTKAEYILANQPRSILCFPIFRQKKLSTILYLENNLAINVFTEDRIEILNILSSQAAISIENARLVQHEKKKQKVQSEMDLARQLQLSLLPALPDDALYKAMASMIPAESVGGDYYDYVVVQGRRYVAMGDVSGHGMNSGVMMLMAQTAFYTYLSSSPSPDLKELYKTLNATLYHNMAIRTRQHLFMTLVALCIDDGGRVEYIGKHEDIFVFRKSTGRVDRILMDGMWVGLMNDVSEFSNKSEFYLSKGDFVVLYTDGLIECRNNHGEGFGVDRLVGIIEQYGNDGIEITKEMILSFCFDFMSKQEDDITLFLLGSSGN